MLQTLVNLIIYTQICNAKKKLGLYSVYCIVQINLFFSIPIKKDSLYVR
jgi:hypothetical protein